MSPAHVLEPTYRRLKQGLMEGEWRQDERLEAQRLADEFGVSMTPVRDSLNRLAGEGLVFFRPGEGYRVPRLTEKNVRDMIELNAIVVSAALSGFDRDKTIDDEPFGKGSYADRIAMVFRQIAQSCGNDHLLEVVEGMSVRLHGVRLAEARLIATSLDDVGLLEAKWRQRDNGLAQIIAAYHHDRAERAGALLSRLPSSR